MLCDFIAVTSKGVFSCFLRRIMVGLGGKCSERRLFVMQLKWISGEIEWNLVELCDNCS
jgi:hypothetical protein